MNAPKTDRLHALDAVRAFALLAGIFLHATMSFFLPVPALDSSQSLTLGILFYVIHIFRMSAFYLIAGFFGRMVLQRRGFTEFAKDRARRILIPMIGGWIILVPITVPIIIWGVTSTTGSDAGALITTPEPVIPLIHLWFLYYLCVFYLFLLAAKWLFDHLIDQSENIRHLIDRVIRAAISSYFAPLLFAAPLALVLYYDNDWLVWFGLPTPDQGLSLKLPAMVGYGAAFSVGWLVHRQFGLINEWAKRWRVHLSLALVTTVASLAIVGFAPGNMLEPDYMTSTGLVVPGPDWMRIVYAACYTVAIWYWTFAIIGCALRYCSTASARIRYIADSSYWLYLAHLPLLMFLQVLVARLQIHWSIKFTAILACAMFVLLVTYRYWVRHTWIGAILNGKRIPGIGSVTEADRATV